MQPAIETIAIETLISPEWNPRKASEKETADLKASIEKFGLVDPVIVNRRNMHIVGGNFRTKVAKSMGLTEVPCVFVDLDDESERELNVRLNKNAGQWDYKLLASFDKNLLQNWGFDKIELSKEFDLDKEIKEDEPPAAPETPTTQSGDVYILGRHRLLCGDATNPDHIVKLMDGKQADMVFTDPHYGVNYEGKTKDRLTIQNDDSADAFARSLPLWPLRPGCPVYVCCPPGSNFLAFASAFSEHLYQSQTIIWVKNSMVLGHGDYHYQHEPIIYGWEKSEAHVFYGDRSQTTIWQIDRPTRSKEHPTMKPLALIAKAIKNSSGIAASIFDPFGGFGSTLMACEQLDRVCYTMEIDPKYCDVIVKRWEKFTGQMAVKAQS